MQSRMFMMIMNMHGGNGRPMIVAATVRACPSGVNDGISNGKLKETNVEQQLKW
jgi:hypothetical protein